MKTRPEWPRTATRQGYGPERGSGISARAHYRGVMFGVRRGLVTLVLATVLVTGGSAVAVATAETASAATQADDAIALDQRFALLPDEPGNVTVELDYAIPNRVISLGV